MTPSAGLAADEWQQVRNQKGVEAENQIQIDMLKLHLARRPTALVRPHQIWSWPSMRCRSASCRRSTSACCCKRYFDSCKAGKQEGCSRPSAESLAALSNGHAYICIYGATHLHGHVSMILMTCQVISIVHPFCLSPPLLERAYSIYGMILSTGDELRVQPPSVTYQ